MTFGSFSSMEHLMVAALFSTTLVDTVSLGFESFLLTAEKMKNNDILLL